MKELKHTPEELVKQIAWMAWTAAANAYRLYPEHTYSFTKYWEAAKSQYSEFEKQNADHLSLCKEMKEALEGLLKRANNLYTYADMPREDYSGETSFRQAKQALESCKKLGI
jgi:hypothetical protein